MKDTHVWNEAVVSGLQIKSKISNVSFVPTQTTPEELRNVINTFVQQSEGILGFENVPYFASAYEALRNTCNIIYIDLSVHTFARSSFYTAGLAKHFVHLFLSCNAETDELYILETLLPNIVSIPMETRDDAVIHFPIVH